MKITKPPTEVYRTSFTRFYTYIVTHKKIVVKTLYFSLICESVGITRLLIFYNFVTILLLGFLYVIRRLYSRYLCILIRGGVFFVWGSCWECVWEGEKICALLLLAPPTHTTHTYTHIFWCVVFRALGVVTHLVKCVCSCRGRSQNDKACFVQYAFGFSILKFWVVNTLLAVFSVLICIAFG